MKGRKPKPTALKILTGNPGHRPLPEHEPIPTGDAVKPSWLPLPAAAIWDELAPRFIALGTLTDCDAETFGRYCVLMAELRVSLTAFPASKHAKLDTLEAKFGMDPSSRARIGSIGQKKKSNPFAQLTG